MRERVRPVRARKYALSERLLAHGACRVTFCMLGVTFIMQGMFLRLQVGFHVCGNFHTHVEGRSHVQYGSFTEFSCLGPFIGLHW